MRKKSKYKPKNLRADNVSWVLSSIKPVTSISAGTTLQLKNHDAMDKLRRGVATKEDIDILIGAFNMAEGYIRLRPEFGMDWAEEIRAGQDAMLEVARRGVANGDRFICRATELTAMNLLMEIHDAQLEACTVSDLEKALAIVESDHKHKKARKII